MSWFNKQKQNEELRIKELRKEIRGALHEMSWDITQRIGEHLADIAVTQKIEGIVDEAMKVYIKSLSNKFPREFIEEVVASINALQVKP